MQAQRLDCVRQNARPANVHFTKSRSMKTTQNAERFTPPEKKALRIRTSTRAIQASIMMMGLACATAQAADIMVDSRLDDDGLGCTLREAIAAANTSVNLGNGCSPGSDNGLDRIVFDNTVFDANNQINLTQGELILNNKNVALSAQTNAQGITLMGGNSQRVMRAVGGDVSLNNFTLTGGRVGYLDDTSQGAGGGLYIGDSTNVVLTNSRITNNRAFNDRVGPGDVGGIDTGGGGIFVSNNSNLTIENSIISNNASSGRSTTGGGISIGGDNGGSNNVVEIHNSEILENTVSSPTSAEGAGLYVGGDNTVTISHSSISRNLGGAIDVAVNGNLNISDSLIIDNSSSAPSPAALDSDGVVSIVRSRISNNISTRISAPNFATIKTGRGAITIEDSTISGNRINSSRRSTVQGGVFDVERTNVVINNTTIHDNGLFGLYTGTVQGGVGSFRYLSTLTFNNVTIANNFVDGTEGFAFAPGILIANSTATFRNTIIADSQNTGNLVDPSSNPAYFADCVQVDSTITIDNSTIIENNPSGSGFFCGEARSGDPGLLPLADNGGATPTLALAPNSIAINTGDTDTCLSTDQRGANRDAQCDVGAFEFGVSAETITVSLAPANIDENGGASTGTVTRSQPFDGPLTIELQSSDVATVTVPSTVQIPAGAASASFAIDAVDNLIADGDRSATVTASADSLIDSTAQITVLDNEVGALNLSVSVNTVAENNDALGEPLTATLSRNTPTDVALTAALSSTDPNTLSVPASVTIPAGQVSATVSITVVDDQLADGDANVTINANADGLLSSGVTLAVTDDEVPTLSLGVAQDSIAENGGTTIANLSRNTPSTSPLEVNLTSANAGRLSVPATVTFLQGQSNVTFAVSAVDNSIADGDANIGITADGNGLQSGLASVNVIDDDVPALNLSLSTNSVSEIEGAFTASLSRNTPGVASLSVALSSSDPSRVTIPSNVIIPAGQTSTTFTVDVLDNALVDGNANLTVIASALGLSNGLAEVTITDDDLPTLTLETPSIEVAETTGTITATLRRNTPDNTGLVMVSLASSDSNRVMVPNNVSFAEGELSTQIDITVIDDAIATGDGVVTISATSDGFVPASLALAVIDNEQSSLLLNFEQTIFNEGSSVRGTLSRNTPSDEPLAISLTSDDDSVVTLPQTVQMPAGVTEVDVFVSSVDNTLIDSQRSITITASDNAGRLSSDSVEFTVLDDDDDDGDTIANQVDNCPVDNNANQANLDGDSFGDACDNDIDGDGMPNSFEQANGLDPRNAADANADNDGDSFSNLEEFEFGSDPNVADDDENDNGIPDAAEARKFNVSPILLLLLGDD